ncbi:MAG TPA: PAS domain S-box protein, partial [Blastocatellia bacterium]|nr:PAS domain S-box protein [Blastocatellia bacterium]
MISDILSFDRDQTDAILTSADPALKMEEPSEDKYRLLFESIPLPVFIYDQSTFSILDVNKAAAGVYGYSRDEFLSMNIRELRPKEEIPR